MVVGAANAVDDGVAHVYIARGHVNFQTQGFAAVWERAVAHFIKQIKVFFHAALAVGAVFARFGKRATVFAHLFGGKVVHIGFAVFNQTNGVIKQLVKVIRRKARLARPMKAQPLYVFFDGADIFIVFFFGIGVVKTQVALPVKDVG